MSPDLLGLLREIADGQRQIIRLLERQQRPRVQTGRDEALMLALAASVTDKAFSAREVMERAALLDVELRAALDAAGLVNARKLGKWLRSIEGRVIAGFRLERLGVDNEGAVWIFRESADSHSHSHVDPSRPPI